mgnify:CR=1 FL=1
MIEPRTEAGRSFHAALWLDGGAEPMRSHLDQEESARAILAIEAEAAASQDMDLAYEAGTEDGLKEGRQQERDAIRVALAALPDATLASPSGIGRLWGTLNRAAVYAILDVRDRP